MQDSRVRMIVKHKVDTVVGRACKAADRGRAEGLDALWRPRTLLAARGSQPAKQLHPRIAVEVATSSRQPPPGLSKAM